LKSFAWLPRRTFSSFSAWSYQALTRTRPPKLPFFTSTSVMSLNGVAKRSPLSQFRLPSPAACCPARPSPRGTAWPGIIGVPEYKPISEASAREYRFRFGSSARQLAPTDNVVFQFTVVPFSNSNWSAAALPA
jgi:hypothetical protein